MLYGTGFLEQPHYHSKCALGDVDTAYFNHHYAEVDACQENVYLGMNPDRFSADHIHEVFACEFRCPSQPMVQMHLTQTWKD
jgi:hypothetical protein